MEEEAARAATTEGKLEYVDNKFAMFTARTGSAMAVDGDKTLWLFGGKLATLQGKSDGEVVSDLFCLPTRGLGGAAAWKAPDTRGKPPAPREQCTITCCLGRFLVVVGGVGPAAAPAPEDSWQDLDEIGILDLPSLTWSTRKVAAPLRRLGHAAGYACGRLLIFGGRDATGKNKNSGVRPPGVEAEPVHTLAALRCADFPQHAALAFSGDNSMFAQVKTSPSLNRLQNQLSLEAWVKPSGFATNAPVACKASASAPTGTALGFGLFAIDEAAAKKL